MSERKLKIAALLKELYDMAEVPRALLSYSVLL